MRVVKKMVKTAMLPFKIGAYGLKKRYLGGSEVIWKIMAHYGLTTLNEPKSKGGGY